MEYKDQSGIVFLLDIDHQTAKIGECKEAKGDIMIPRSVIHEGKEFIVISLEKYSFFNNDYIKSISFPDDSCVRSFGTKSFTLSAIQKIQFPKSLEKLEDDWCSSTEKLKSIDLSPENPNFSYLDDNHKIIIGKSDPKNSIFDVLVFACRDIQTVIIPSFIKHICPSAFYQCQQFKKIQFEDKSQLETIGKSCFKLTRFEEIKFPQTLKTIGRDIFRESGLKKCQFDENCQIKIIPRESFFSSRLQIVSIPKDVYLLDYRWAAYSEITTIILSPLNPHLTYIDNQHKIIAGKTDINSPVFNIIFFACRNVKRAQIPSSIKHIASNAFEGCYKLESLEFDQGTSIETLGDCCFSQCRSLQRVSLPKGLKHYGDDVFERCDNMVSIDILDEIVYISPSFLPHCGQLEVLNCPNATIIVYDKHSFEYLSPNFTVNRPPNALFTNDDSDENRKIRMKFDINFIHSEICI